MKNIKYIVVFLLAISIFCNFFLIAKVKDLEESIQQITYYQSNMMGNINSQASTVQSILNEYKEEQSWISAFHMNVEDENLHDGETNVRFEWLLKEFPKNSQVTFHYKFGESNDYQSIPANEIENGLFEVNVPIEIQFEPEWYVHLSMTDSSNNIEETAVEEKEMRKTELSYYVTVSHDDGVRSSDIVTENLGYIGGNYFGTLDTNVHIDNDYLHVAVFNHHQDMVVSIEDLYVVVYNGDEKIGEYKLKPNNTNNDPYSSSTDYYFDSQEKMDYTRVVLKVEYNDGSSFEKEVYK